MLAQQGCEMEQIGGIPRSVVDDAIEAARDAEWQKRLALFRELNTTTRGATLSAVTYWGMNGAQDWAYDLADKVFRLQPSPPLSDADCPATGEGKAEQRNIERIVAWEGRRLEEEFRARSLAVYAPTPLEGLAFEGEGDWECPEWANVVGMLLLAPIAYFALVVLLGALAGATGR